MDEVDKKNFTIKGFDGMKVILLFILILSSGLVYASLFDSYSYRKIYLILFIVTVIANIAYNTLDSYSSKRQ